MHIALECPHTASCWLLAHASLQTANVVTWYPRWQRTAYERLGRVGRDPSYA